MAVADNSILVYRLLPATELANREAEIARVLFGDQYRDGRDQRLYVSPTSGCISYFNRARLRNRSVADQLPKADEAEAAAVRFLQSANQSLGRNPLGSLRQLFPTDLRHVITGPVYSTAKSQVDHWLVRFIAFLDTGRGVRQPAITKPDPPQRPIPPAITPPELVTVSTSPPPPRLEFGGNAPVDGGIVEVRVGTGSQIVGLNSRWRPYDATKLARMLPLSNEVEANSAIRLVYVLGGDEEPMEFAAPYYLVPGDDPDTGGYLPASDHSLAVNFIREDGTDAVTISADLSGNAGPVRYVWGAWRIDLGPAYGLQILGTDNRVTLPPGVYNIVLDVQDTLTGAFARQQALVYFGSSANTSAPDS